MTECLEAVFFSLFFLIIVKNNIKLHNILESPEFREVIYSYLLRKQTLVIN